MKGTMKMKISILHLHLPREGRPPHNHPSPPPDQTIPPPLNIKILGGGNTGRVYASDSGGM